MRPHRSLVLASLPQACGVCRDDRKVRLVALAGMCSTGLVACPHCSAGHHPIPIPILTLPMRQDQPSGGAA